MKLYKREVKQINSEVERADVGCVVTSHLDAKPTCRESSRPSRSCSDTESTRNANLDAQERAEESGACMAALFTRLQIANGLAKKHQKNERQSTTLAQYSEVKEHQVPLTQHQRSHSRQFKRLNMHSSFKAHSATSNAKSDRGAMDQWRQMQ